MSSVPADRLSSHDEVGNSKAGHPPGLYVLFGAEMWERLSYYGMRALLVLYLVKHLKYERPAALDLYATYTGLVYLTPLLGGYLADKFLGQRKAVFIGGLLMALGHFAMAFEPLLFVALGLIILGNGFFKPNISTMVGQLYAPGDARRDSAYTIFYMGINTGAFLAPIICGYLGESQRFGWHYGFAAAGVGMVIGLLNFALFQRVLGPIGFPPGRSETGSARIGVADILHIVLITATGAALVYTAVSAAPKIHSMLPPKIASLGVMAYWIALAFVLIAVTGLITRGSIAADARNESAGEAKSISARNAPFTPQDWQRIVVILVVAMFSIVFWMGFEQAGGTFTLFADAETNRSVPQFVEKITGDPTFPASLYQTINPLLIVLLAFLPLAIWSALERAGIHVNSAAKMGIGLILLGVGFIIMNYADSQFSKSNKAGPQWLAYVYFFNSIGELCLSPIGLSLVNKLAPARIASLMMAVWFLCTAIANYLAGIMEELLKHQLPQVPLFSFLIWTSLISGLMLLALSPLLKKMSQGRI
ncbi:MAG: hypothetical protein JWN86_381 [Planctomycetota bacterium]|nr:hypothetical protein [Planctomycetota bacterium]